jgi:hypothetical protein
MHIPNPVAHSVLGFDFTLPYMFNWPLIPDQLRSPFTAFPQALLLPMTLVRDFGTVLAVLALFGAAWMMRNRRRDALLLLGFMAPVYLVLMIQGNWSEHDKLRFVINLYAPVVLCAWAALVFLFRRGRRVVFLAATLGASLGLSLAVRAADGLRFPVDPRAYEVRPAMPREGDAEYAITRKEFVAGSPFPRDLIGSVLFSGGNWRQAVYEVSHPRYEDQTEPIPEKMGPVFAPELYRREFRSDVAWRPEDPFPPPAREPVRVRLDLTEMPTRQCAPVRVLSEPSPAALDLATQPGPVILTNRKVPFSDNAVDLVILRLQMPQEFLLAVVTLRVPGFYPDPPVPLPEGILDLAVNRDANMMLWMAVYTVPTVLFTWDVPLGDDGPEPGVCLEAWKG